MKNTLCNTKSTGKSIIYIICPLQQRAAGLLLWARPAGDVDRLPHDTL